MQNNKQTSVDVD